MNPLGNYVEENKAYVERLLSGKMKVALVICYECKNLYLTEVGPNHVEFSSSCCPFCGVEEKIHTQMTSGEEMLDQVESLARGEGRVADDDAFTEKVKRVLLKGEEQRYNVAACANCNNRFIYLHDDGDEIGCCAFCGCEDELEELIRPPENAPQAMRGLSSYIGKLFYIELDTNQNGNFILTDIDPITRRIRFVSPEDGRMAFWVSDSSITTMMEFVKLMPDDETDTEE